MITFENESSDICVSVQVYYGTAERTQLLPAVPGLERANASASWACGASFSFRPAKRCLLYP